MLLKRSGGAILNTDNESYLAAKKRSELLKERKRKDKILEQLYTKVMSLEKKLNEMQKEIEEMKSKNDSC